MHCCVCSDLVAAVGLHVWLLAALGGRSHYLLLVLPEGCHEGGDRTLNVYITFDSQPLCSAAAATPPGAI